jgi:hypothetical protein
MFSINNFYDYLIHRYSTPKESNNLVYQFVEDGSRDIIKLNSSIQTDIATNKFKGAVAQFDQEPVIFDYFSFSEQLPSHHLFTKQENIFNYLSKVHTSIICHSELNSSEIKAFNEKGFLDVHYWWHGIIGQDWFRNFKYYKTLNVDNKTRFGLYARDASGSRTYRVNLLDRLSDMHKSVYFHFQPEMFKMCNKEVQNKWPLSNTYYSSKASAAIEWSDTEKFDIQLVAETMFETDKTHLTEKVLKPIVMQQPFILLAGPNSLKYIKKYGFKTFDSLWDESYDSISDHNKRFERIIQLIKTLHSLSDYKFKDLINKALEIAEYNKNHFFSEQCQTTMMNELHYNFDNALQTQNERFFTNPGGLLFEYYNETYRRNNNKFVPTHRRLSNEVILYINQKYPDVAKQIVKKYPDLF